MKLNIYCKSTTLLAGLFAITFADSDTRTVQAEFDRCNAVLERFERSFRRYEDAVDAIKRNEAKLGVTGHESVSREAAAFENRLEYCSPIPSITCTPPYGSNARSVSYDTIHNRAK